MRVAYACSQGIGHMKYLIPMITESLARGHDVTLFCPDEPIFEQELKREGVDERILVRLTMSNNKDRMSLYPGILNKINAGGPLAIFCEEMYDPILAYYEKDENNIPDVFVIDFFATAASDAADYLDIPVVVGYPCPFNFFDLPPPEQRGLKQMLKGIVASYFIGPMITILGTYLRNKERNGRNLPLLQQHDIIPSLRQTRHMIAFTAIGLEYNCKTSPLLHIVGSSRPMNPPQLGNDLRKWIDEQTKPIVYLSFGSKADCKRATIENVMRELLSISDKASFICSLSAANQELIPSSIKLPDTIRIEAWLPQWSILAHPKVVAFTTHCGSNSIFESILNNVPIIGVPLGKDQPANAARVKAAYIGAIVENGADGAVGKSIEYVLHNLSKYVEPLSKLNDIFNNLGGASEAVNIVENVATEAKQMKTKSEMDS